MRYILENETLKVEVESFGAELKSVYSKAEDKEYMWYADSKYWGRTSPVLFPFVGSLKNKEYQYQGNTYAMGQHGFARDMEHTLVRKEENSIWFCLKSNEETNAKYPFDFVLEIGYELKGNEVKVLWKVTNPSEKEMHFSIGAHPAFLCPFNAEKDKTGYSLCFDGLKEVLYHGITGDTGLSLKEELVLPLNEEKIALTPEFFDRCAYIVEGKQTGAVGLVTPEGRRYVNVSFDTPLFAVWSPEGKNAPFVCIEPWYGRCDAEDFAGTLEEREYNNRLEGKETFEASYTITFS